MEIIKAGGWVFYVTDEANKLDRHRCGKWMYFFSDKKFVEQICRTAVENNVVVESKHTDAQEGVACFYLNIDDMDRHKKVIKFFLENNLIRRTKTGKLYNIAFKLDEQTYKGEYRDAFVSELKLEKLIDLETGEWR